MDSLGADNSTTSCAVPAPYKVQKDEAASSFCLQVS